MGVVGGGGGGYAALGGKSCEMIAVRSEFSSHHALCRRGVIPSAASLECMQIAAVGRGGVGWRTLLVWTRGDGVWRRE